MSADRLEPSAGPGDPRVTEERASPSASREEVEETYCYGHPDTPTRLRCSRCDRPICGRCAIPATVGQHCPWCVAEARKTAPRIRSAMAASAPATLTIIVISVVFYLVQRVYPPLTLLLASSPVAIHNGDWYRLMTPMLLHSPTLILHILFNMIVLWSYGPHVEKGFGTSRFLAVYLISGFTAGATSYAFSSCDIIGVGASGAIFGVVGALLVFLYNRRRSDFVRSYMRNLLVFIGINLVFGLLGSGVGIRIDNWAHMGGLVGGLALGLAFDGPLVGRRGATLQAGAALAVIAAGVLLVVYRTATFGCA